MQPSTPRPGSLKLPILLVCLALLVSSFGPRNPTETIISGNITKDTTWSGGVFRVTRAIDVQSGVRLVVLPGTTVIFDAGAGIDVYGQLVVQGDPSSLAVFTSDLAFHGAWRGLRIFANDPRGLSEIAYAVIEYGGSLGGSLSVDNASVIVNHGIIRYGSQDGIRGYAGGSASVQDTLIEHHFGYALRFADPSIDQDLARLDATNNGGDVIALTGGGNSLGGDRLWEDAGLPYQILGTGFSVAAGETLTIEPGVVLLFSPLSSLNVGGRLIAAGTPQDQIRFSGVEATPGSWAGLKFTGLAATPASGVLSYAVVENGGSGSQGGNLNLVNANVSVTYSRLQYSAGYGVYAGSGGLARVNYTHIQDNALGGAKTIDLRPGRELQAQYNWWGAPSGPYHPVTNPLANGQSVSDHVIYDPWLTNPLEAGPLADRPPELAVQVLGRTAFAPGSRQTYAITYRNGTISTINQAVLVAFLPDHGNYLENEGQGMYWPSRNQVYWRLGDLAPGASGVVAVTVQYPWGLPFDLGDGVIAALAGSNTTNTLVNVSDYLNFTPPTLAERRELTTSEIDAFLAGNAEAAAYYQQALAEGYRLIDGYYSRRSDGATLNELNMLLIEPLQTYATIYASPLGVTFRTVNRDSFHMETAQGVMDYDPYLRDWVVREAPAGGRVTAQASQEYCGTFGQCMNNCLVEYGRSKIADKLMPAQAIAEKLSSCAAAREGDDAGVIQCGKEVGSAVLPFGGSIDFGTDMGVCNSGCSSDPCSHICTKDISYCEPGLVYGFAGGTFSSVMKRKCDTSTGRLGPRESAETCVNVGGAFFGASKCVVGENGKARCQVCSTGTTNHSFASLSELRLQEATTPTSDEASGGQCASCQPAQDPNAKIGVEGLVAPGQTLTYTVQYENVGLGEAYGVFVTDRLPPEFDESGLVLGPNGRYLPAARLILWEVGTLAAKGEPGSSGELSFSAPLRSDLPSGTVVSNRATVYFPSVPETTPTNAVANIVQPLAGLDQELVTTATQPLAFNLQGSSAAGGPLTYNVVSGSGYGALSGTPPALVYSASPGFSGIDQVWFTASDGSSTSQPALVSIQVLPDPDDAAPPKVTGSSPPAGATIPIGVRPAAQDSLGNLYDPLIQVYFDEALDSASLNGSLTLVDGQGVQIPVATSFDPARRALLVVPRVALRPGLSLTLRLAPPLADLAGNQLAAPYQLTFETMANPNQAMYLPFIVP